MAASKRQRCDTELRLGGCGWADDASETKKEVAAAVAYYDGDRLSRQPAAAATVSGRGDAAEMEAQAGAIIGMARRAAGARLSDRGAARRRRSLRWFLQRRREREVMSRRGGASSSSPSSSACS